MSNNEAIEIIKKYDPDYYEYIQNNAKVVHDLMIENYTEFLRRKHNENSEMQRM